MDWLIKHTRRIFRVTAGLIILIVGIILMLPGIPGPGFVFTLLGISMLSVDFVWARRLKVRLQLEAKKLKEKIRSKKRH